MISVLPGSVICTVVALCVLIIELDALEDAAQMQNQISFLLQRVYNQSILRSVIIYGYVKLDRGPKFGWSVDSPMVHVK